MAPPAIAAMPPTSDRAEHAGEAGRPGDRRADAAADADRVGVGDSEPWTGMLFDLVMPTPKRDQNSAKAFAARPHENTISEKKAVAQPMTGARRKRSASQPIGSAPRTMNAPDAALMNTIVPSLTPRLSRMSGASTDRIAFSSSSTDWISSSITNVKTPPTLTPCLQRHLVRRRPPGGGRRRTGFRARLRVGAHVAPTRHRASCEPAQRHRASGVWAGSLASMAMWSCARTSLIVLGCQARVVVGRVIVGHVDRALPVQPSSRTMFLVGFVPTEDVGGR